jgi:hypothetical protein
MENNTGVSHWKPLLVSFLGQSCKVAFGNVEKKEAAPRIEAQSGAILIFPPHGIP